DRRSSTKAARSTTWTRLIQALESGIHTAGSVSAEGVGSGSAAMSMARPAYTVRLLATTGGGSASAIVSTQRPPTLGSVSIQALATSATMGASSGAAATRTGSSPAQLDALAATMRIVMAVTTTSAAATASARGIRPRPSWPALRWRPDTFPLRRHCLRGGPPTGHGTCSASVRIGYEIATLAPPDSRAFGTGYRE